MKIIEYSYKVNDKTTFPEYLRHTKDKSHILFFDIETTGLSARNSTLYLIGALWYDNDTVNVRQWFNEDGYAEADIITSFDSFCRNFSHLVHFNGLTFDVPYIREKAQRYSINIDNIDNLIQFDIYKEIRSYKNILGLENMKQISIEKFLGINREDTYNGGDLINVYQRYVARPDDEKEHLLLLHNHDDLLGMPGVCAILQYKALLEHPEFEIEKIDYNDNDSKLYIDISLDESCFLPKRLIHTNKDSVYINVVDNSATLIIPIINSKLKHFFKDYKNYYYLPAEDMAIHKSVATYVDSQNRERATKSNCYVSKKDLFIICPDKNYEESFKDSINDKQCYRTLDSLLNDTTTGKKEYILFLMKTIK